MKTVGKGLVSAALGLVAFGLMLFLPAGTFHYWQAWVFLAVFALSTWIPSVYLMRTNPAALERRMHAGPLAETRTLQRIVITVLFICFPAMFVVSALDHRFGWSPVPAAVIVVGDVLVAVGLGVAMLVVIQNGYAAANITVEAGQKLVSTGLYGLVRHPMYTGNVIMMVGIPLGARVVLGTGLRHPRAGGAGASHPRRRGAARAGVERIQRVRAAGALPPGAATSGDAPKAG